MIECWYKKVCKSITDGCEKNCVRYTEMKYLMESSNLPKNKQTVLKLVPSEIDVENFKFLAQIKKDIADFVINGESLYIFSLYYGNGKTTWAIKLMQNYFNQIWSGNGLTQRGLFIHTPSFLLKLKENITNRDIQFEELKKQLLQVDLVIWDDIATNRLTDYEYINLLAYIDQRKLQGKANIYTGNLNETELITAVGGKLKNRIWDDSTIVELRGTNRREE